MGELDEAQAEINNDLLDSWIGVYKKAVVIYDGLPDDQKAWIEEHGHEVESLVQVVAWMKPHVRALCLSLVEQGRAVSMSQPVDTVEDTNESAKSGGEEVGEQGRIEQLEAEVRSLRAALDTIAAVSATAAAMHADAGDEGVPDDLRQRGIAS